MYYFQGSRDIPPPPPWGPHHQQVGRQNATRFTLNGSQERPTMKNIQKSQMCLLIERNCNSIPLFTKLTETTSL